MKMAGENGSQKQFYSETVIHVTR